MPPLLMPERTWCNTPSTLPPAKLHLSRRRERSRRLRGAGEGASDIARSRAAGHHLITKIRTPDRLIAADVLRRAGDHDPPGLQQIRLFRDVQRQAGILLHHKDRHTRLGPDA